MKRKPGAALKRACEAGTNLGRLPLASKGQVNLMWFKAFVLLRLPISVGCLLGYAMALKSWNKLDMEVFGYLLIVGASLFLTVVTIMLFRFRKSALRLAWLLLAVEAAGVVSLMNEGEFVGPSSGQPENPFYVALCVIPIAWALPNVFMFYKARPLFIEVEKQKPGCGTIRH